MDEYCIQALPEFDGKRFQNVAKEGVKFDESEKTKENREATEKEYEPLLNWMKDKALKDKVLCREQTPASTLKSYPQTTPAALVTTSGCREWCL